jgi:hypothetical protein
MFVCSNSCLFRHACRRTDNGSRSRHAHCSSSPHLCLRFSTGRCKHDRRERYASNDAMLLIITDFILSESVTGYVVVPCRVSKGFELDSWLADVPYAEVRRTIQQTCAVRIVKVEDEHRLKGSYTSPSK